MHYYLDSTQMQLAVEIKCAAIKCHNRVDNKASGESKKPKPAKTGHNFAFLSIFE